jgi:hypothetical protein
MSGNLSKIDILRIFKDNLLDFLDDLVNHFPHESDFVMLQLVCSDSPIEPIIDKFSKIIIPYKKMVEEENEVFFLEKCSTILKDIKSLNTDKIDHFKRIWTSPRMTRDDKKQMFRWFKLFLSLSVQWTT